MSALARRSIHAVPRPLAVGAALALVALSGVAGCGKMADRAMPADAKAVAAAPAAQDARVALPGARAASAADPQRALRITAETSVVVDDVAAAARSIRDVTASSGGYVGEAHASSNGGSTSAYFELHVPAAKLGELRTEVGKLGEVTSDNEKAEDLTEQRADLDARIHNARAQEKRLLELLGDRTGALADVDRGREGTISGVRETIELHGAAAARARGSDLVRDGEALHLVARRRDRRRRPRAPRRERDRRRDLDRGLVSSSGSPWSSRRPDRRRPSSPRSRTASTARAAASCAAAARERSSFRDRQAGPMRTRPSAPAGFEAERLADDGEGIGRRIVDLRTTWVRRANHELAVSAPVTPVGRSRAPSRSREAIETIT